MIKLTDILNEGVYDPGIFKAVFTGGGPGSGKSFAASSLFGIPEKMPFVSAKGLKGVNTDSAFESMLNKSGLGIDLASMDPAQFAQSQEIRSKAKKAVAAQLENYIKGRLGMIIDGTGHDYSKIVTKKTRLEKLGYDTFMIFVNTSLDVALERNEARERTLPVNIVKKYWSACQNNLGKFQGAFGVSNMLIIDNSEYKDFSKKVKQAASKFVSKPIQNHVAKAWIKKELQIRKG
jgi:predicted kinase